MSPGVARHDWSEAGKAVARLFENVSRVIIGTSEAVELMLVALLCEGHVLLEDMPRVGETLLAKALSRSLGCTFRRIQFTPDLLPSGVTGSRVFDQKTAEFEFRPAPPDSIYTPLDMSSCAGDLVDYGAQPEPVIAFAREHATAVVQGNHDYALATRADCRCSERFRPASLATRRITRQALSHSDLSFLAEQPASAWVTLGGQRIAFFHATPQEPRFR